MPAVFLTNDLLFSSSVAATSRDAGVAVKVIGVANKLVEEIETGEASVVLLDLSTPGLNLSELVPEIRQKSTNPIRIIVYAPHVHEGKLAEARALGCDAVLTRGQFHSQMSELIAALGQS